MCKKMYHGLLLTIAALCCLAVILISEGDTAPLVELVSFQENICGRNIKLYYDGTEDVYTLFLPSYAGAGDLQPIVSDGLAVSFRTTSDEAMVEPADLPLNAEFFMEISQGSRSETARMRIHCSAGLDTICIETKTGKLENIHSDKSRKEEAAITVIQPDGTLCHTTMGKISGRGNTTWAQPKRPYTVTFEAPVSFGVFQDVQKLCLLANYLDDSRLRNSIVYYGAQELGVAYPSPYQFADVYINGEYMGLYGLATKYEYEKYMAEDQVQAVFEIATTGKGSGFRTELGLRINVMAGDGELARNAVERLESALLTGDWAEVESCINVREFAEKYALEEFFGNLDLTWPSKYFYLDSHGIIRTMMAWDYDWSLANAGDIFSDTASQELNVYIMNMEHSWFRYLLDFEPFALQVRDALRRQYTPELLDKLKTHAEEEAAAIAQAYQGDRLRWKAERPAYPEAGDLWDLETYPGKFADYFDKRQEFLLSYFSDTAQYCHVSVVYNRGRPENCICVKKGTGIAGILNSELIRYYQICDGFQGWYLDSGQPLDPELVLTGDITLWAELAEDEMETDQSFWKKIEQKIHGGEADNVWIALFGMLMLGLAAVEVHSWRRTRRNTD